MKPSRLFLTILKEAMSDDVINLNHDAFKYNFSYFQCDVFLKEALYRKSLRTNKRERKEEGTEKQKNVSHACPYACEGMII